MPVLEGVQFEAYCAMCNAGLCGQVRVVPTRERKMPSIRIVPCPQCLAQAGGVGFTAGHTAGVQTQVLNDATLRWLDEQIAREQAAGATTGTEP